VQLLLCIILPFDFFRFFIGQAVVHFSQTLQLSLIRIERAALFSKRGHIEPCIKPRRRETVENPRFFIIPVFMSRQTAVILRCVFKMLRLTNFFDGLKSDVMFGTLFGMKKCSAYITLIWPRGNKSVSALAPSPENIICVQKIITFLPRIEAMCFVTKPRIIRGTREPYMG